MGCDEATSTQRQLAAKVNLGILEIPTTTKKQTLGMEDGVLSSLYLFKTGGNSNQRVIMRRRRRKLKEGKRFANKKGGE